MIILLIILVFSYFTIKRKTFPGTIIDKTSVIMLTFASMVIINFMTVLNQEVNYRTIPINNSTYHLISTIHPEVKDKLELGSLTIKETKFKERYNYYLFYIIPKKIMRKKIKKTELIIEKWNQNNQREIIKTIHKE